MSRWVGRVVAWHLRWVGYGFSGQWVDVSNAKLASEWVRKVSLPSLIMHDVLYNTFPALKLLEFGTTQLVYSQIFQ